MWVLCVNLSYCVIVTSDLLQSEALRYIAFYHWRKATLELVLNYNRNKETENTQLFIDCFLSELNYAKVTRLVVETCRDLIGESNPTRNFASNISVQENSSCAIPDIYRRPKYPV